MQKNEQNNSKYSIYIRNLSIGSGVLVLGYLYFFPQSKKIITVEPPLPFCYVLLSGNIVIQDKDGKETKLKSGSVEPEDFPAGQSIIQAGNYKIKIKKKKDQTQYSIRIFPYEDKEPIVRNITIDSCVDELEKNITIQKSELNNNGSETKSEKGNVHIIHYPHDIPVNKPRLVTIEIPLIIGFESNQIEKITIDGTKYDSPVYQQSSLFLDVDYKQKNIEIIVQNKKGKKQKIVVPKKSIEENKDEIFKTLMPDIDGND
jgi:hypothetical protein